ERTAKRVKIIQARRARLLASATHLRHTDTHGHRLRRRALRKEPEDDQAVAVPRHGDTPPPGQNPNQGVKRQAKWRIERWPDLRGSLVRCVSARWRWCWGALP